MCDNSKKSDVLADRSHPCVAYTPVFTVHISIPSTDASTCEEIRSVILADCVSIVCCRALIRTRSLERLKLQWVRQILNTQDYTRLHVYTITIIPVA